MTTITRQPPSRVRVAVPFSKTLTAKHEASYEYADFTFFAIASLITSGGKVVRGGLRGTTTVNDSGNYSSHQFAFPNISIRDVGHYYIRVDVYVVSNGSTLLGQATTSSVAATM